MNSQIEPAMAVEEQSGTAMEESVVSVEKLGDCTSVKVKCPCGQRYQLLVSGTDCYYKLM